LIGVFSFSIFLRFFLWFILFFVFLIVVHNDSRGFLGCFPLVSWFLGCIFT
jgi:hypothetical protein